MKLRIGDKVRFLNEVGEGVVSQIKDKFTVYVEMNDGFEIPIASNQLVPIYTELIIDKDSENIELNSDSNLNDAIYFVIEPDHELPSLINDYKIYIFNSSSFNLLFSYSIKEQDHFQTIKHGEVGAYQKIFLRTIKLNYFIEYNYHKFECLLFKNTFFKSQTPISELIFINQTLLSNVKTIKHDQFKYPVYAFLLKDNFIDITKIEQDLSLIDIERLKGIKEFNTLSKTSKSNKEYLKTLEKEVDLHINELIDKTIGLSNFEMLNIQLECFEKELDMAIAKKFKKIIFIHGVGNGRLKQEIISILKTTNGLTYHDASYKEYGYGATQINII